MRPAALVLLGYVGLVACSAGTVLSPVAIVAFASPSPAPTATATAPADPAEGGVVVVQVPTPAPVICSPSPVSVPVGQTAVIDCTSAGYNGPIGWTVANPSVASVQLAAGTYTFFYVSGVSAGTTSVSFSFAAGGAGSESVTVTP